MATDKFKAWAKKYGIQRLAKELEVHQSTVYGWINGSIVPNDGRRLSILEKAGRKLKLGDIVDGY